MAASVRKCPGCAEPMQSLFAREVEFDGCPGCGGMWFDAGTLTRVIGRDALIEPREGSTPRRCPYCEIALTNTRLGEQIDVETCSMCGGTYLDEGELDLAAGEHILESVRQRPKRYQPRFRCPKCSKWFPMREGNATASGLCCPGCTPTPRSAATPDPSPHVRLLDASWDDVVDFIVHLLS